GHADVVLVEPGEEIAHHGVAPHPAREADEIRERSVGRMIAAAASDEAVDARGIRPICFPADGAKASLGDEAARELGAEFVEIVRAVAGFSDQDAAAIC